MSSPSFRHVFFRLVCQANFSLQLKTKPLILHTLEQTKKANNIDRVIVATDSKEILRVVEESGNEAVLTSDKHQSGSDRIAEVAEGLPENSIIVNVQGDEPLIPKSTIEKAVEAILKDETIDIATTCEPIKNIGDVLSPDVVKVVTDKNDFALYFSRSPIPFPREAVRKHGSLRNALRKDLDLVSLYRKHTGLYVYRREYLLKYTKEKQTNLEKTEMLEQLRALENGAKIKVVEVVESSIGVDTQEDFDRVKKIIEDQNKQIQFGDYIFRFAKFEDLPEIAKVFVESSQKSYRGFVPQSFLDNLSEAEQEKDLLESFLNDNNKIFIVENIKGKIVGFVEVRELPNTTDFDSMVSSMYVLSEYQRMGIGTKLFSLVAKELSSEGIKSMILEALEVVPFKKFYKK